MRSDARKRLNDAPEMPRCVSHGCDQYGYIKSERHGAQLCPSHALFGPTTEPPSEYERGRADVGAELAQIAANYTPNGTGWPQVIPFSAIAHLTKDPT